MGRGRGGGGGEGEGTEGDRGATAQKQGHSWPGGRGGRSQRSECPLGPRGILWHSPDGKPLSSFSANLKHLPGALELLVMEKACVHLAHALESETEGLPAATFCCMNRT